MYVLSLWKTPTHTCPRTPSPWSEPPYLSMALMASRPWRWLTLFFACIFWQNKIEIQTFTFASRYCLWKGGWEFFYFLPEARAVRVGSHQVSRGEQAWRTIGSAWAVSPHKSSPSAEKTRGIYQNNHNSCVERKELEIWPKAKRSRFFAATIAVQGGGRVDILTFDLASDGVGVK